MRNIIILGFILFITNSCFALQTKLVNDNETVSATVSQKDKTHVVVEGDRIASIHGTPNAYVYNNDDVLGQVYLMPTQAYAQKPFDLFITTESGKTYGLELTPNNNSGDTILLKPQDNNVVQIQTRKTVTNYNLQAEGYSSSRID